MRALVIEDDIELREQVCERLRSEGYAVDSTGEGEEGLFYAKEYPIDIAIVDLGLPGPTGLDIITEVREAGLDYPILILTARSRWQDKVEGLEAGADDYVVSPSSRKNCLPVSRLWCAARAAGLSHDSSPAISYSTPRARKSSSARTRST